MAGKLTSAQILETLDAAAKDGQIPAFSNLNVDYIFSRLSAHREGDRWAIVFNSVAWMEGIKAIVDPVGNSVEYRQGASIAEESLSALPAKQEFDAMMQKMPDMGLIESFTTALKATRSMIRSVPEMTASYQRTMQSAADAGATENDKYIDAGDILIDEETETITGASIRDSSVRVPLLEPDPRPDLGLDPVFRTAVALTEKYREQLLAQPAEMARFFPAGLPTQILALDQWHHVDVNADELPSESETFRLLADVIASGDASRYRPTLAPNTHWSNWFPK